MHSGIPISANDADLYFGQNKKILLPTGLCTYGIIKCYLSGQDLETDLRSYKQTGWLACQTFAREGSWPR